MYDRLINIFSEEKIKLLNKTNVLLVGVGGVGSFCFEVLIRSGIENITIVDYDTYEETNLNRQLNSNINNIGVKKIEVLKKHALEINPKINIETIDEYLSDKSILDFTKYDYIIDACDSIKAKILLITKAHELNIPIICSLGVGNRKEPKKISISTLRKTINDPLGKKLRHELNKIGFPQDVMVVSSSEQPIKSDKGIISSYIGVSSYAGILLADYVIKEVTNGNKKH